MRLSAAAKIAATSRRAMVAARASAAGGAAPTQEVAPTMAAFAAFMDIHQPPSYSRAPEQKVDARMKYEERQ